MAAADPERAEAIARSIKDDSARGSALARVAKVVASADPEQAAWLAAEAETAVRLMEDGLGRQRQLGEVAALVAAADPVQAVRLAMEVEGNIVLPGFPSSLMTPKLKVALQFQRIILGNPLAGVAEAVAAADPERAEAIARSIEDAFWRSSALARLARWLATGERVYLKAMYSRRTALFTLLGVVTRREAPRGRCRVR